MGRHAMADAVRTEAEPRVEGASRGGEALRDGCRDERGAFQALLALALRRMTARVEFRLAVTFGLVVALVGFAQTCAVMFGSDRAALPSAAYAWAANANMQAVTLNVYFFFLMMPLAAMAGADALATEVRRGIAACLASRASTQAYVAAHALATCLGAVAMTVAPLLLMQALALLVFPLDGSFEGYINTPVYQAVEYTGTFAGLYPEHPYLMNLAYVLYDAVWTAAVSLLAFALALVARRSRVVALGTPVAFGVLNTLGSSLLPQSEGAPSMLVAHYLFPNSYVGASVISPVFAVAAPLAVAGVALALTVAAVRGKGDVLL